MAAEYGAKAKEMEAKYNEMMEKMGTNQSGSEGAEGAEGTEGAQVSANEEPSFDWTTHFSLSFVSSKDKIMQGVLKIQRDTLWFAISDSKVSLIHW